MCSERQAAANKLNAQKSTGPKTAEGKNKASQNAVTHGLTSHRPVLDNEDTAEFRKYVNELIDQLDPTNPWEFVFAKRASCQAWRIQRALCYETLALENLVSNVGQASPLDKDKVKNKKPNNNTQARSVRVASKRSEDGSDGIDSNLPVHPNEQDDPKSLLGQAIVDDFRNHWTLDKLARYETRLENSMIRCLGKFQKVRESQMMNFTSLRHYYRGFTRRPQDFQDNVGEASVLHSKSAPTPKESSSPSVDEASVLHIEIDKTNPISAFSAQKPVLDTEKTKNEPNSQAPTALVASQRSEDGSEPISAADTPDSNSAPQHGDASDVSLFDQQTAALINDDFNSFSQWADLKGHAYGYDDESFEPHCPNPPSTGEYLYVENWHHKLLRMVNYPWDKRKNLTKAQLNEMVDTILCSMSDPVQFLWDFGLIELTAEAVGKRSLAAQAEEQVPALAC
jgi:hypothetical protein